MLQENAINSTGPIQPTERIQVLDVLRGIALFGMIISHVDGLEEKAPRSAISQVIADGVNYLIDGRFYTLFAILFGAGFAIQLMKAKNRSENFIPRFLRRMFALACFGFIINVGFGYAILYSYAISGLLLLLIRNWSTKMLFILFLICVMLNPLYRIIKNTASTAIYGTELTLQKNKQRNDKIRALRITQFRRDSIADNTGNYFTAIKARTEHFIINQPTRIEVVIHLLSTTFMLILIGFIAMRLKIFEEPGKHRKLIISMMIIGLVFSAVAFWGLPFFNITPNIKYPAVAHPIEVIINFLSRGFDIFRDNWLSFTYAGIILLLVSYNPGKWFKRLKFFAWTGRMALTNYFFQAMILNLLFAKYAVALPRIPESMVPVYSLLLFTALVLFSRWWLNRFQYGPLEWLWRSVTYWKIQPMRLKAEVKLAVKSN